MGGIAQIGAVPPDAAAPGTASGVVVAATELGAILVAAGRLTAPALARAANLQRETGERLDADAQRLNA
jgi:hypothetical protein